MRLLSSVQGENLFTLHQNENLEKQQEIFYNAIHPFWIIQNTCIVRKNYKFIIIINFVEDCIPFRGNRFIRGNLLLWLKIDHFTKNVIIHTSTYCIDKKCIEWFHETWKIFYQIFNCKVCSTASIQVAFLFKKGEELIGKVVVCYA